MKKLIIILTFLIICASCNTFKRDNFHYRNNDKNVWINTFKAEAFYSCVKEGTKNDSLFILLKNKDLLNLYDGYPFNTTDKARNLGKKIMQKIPPPYIKIDDDEQELKNKNFISYTCLNYYASRELDSIAKVEYKKYLKSNDSE